MRSVALVTVGLGLAIPGLVRAELPTVDQVIAKCLASYDAAKTYQGTVVIRIDRGGQRTHVSMDLKAENNAKGEIARSSMHIVQSASGPSGDMSSDVTIIDTGKRAFTVDARAKQYREMPHSVDRVSGMFRRLMENAKSSVSTLKVSLGQYHGRSVYKVAGSGVSGTVSLVVDRSTYMLYSASASGGVGAAKLQTELIASDQVFNQPIKADSFTWSPPAGFTRVSGGQ